MRTTIMSRILKVLFFFYLSLKTTVSQNPPSTGLYIMLGDDIIPPAESVNMYDIGSQPADLSNPGSTLVCVTTNVNKECCRAMDRDDGRTTGDWFFMNNTIPRSPISSSTDTFHTIHWQQQVRLSRSTDQIGTSGFYKCVIPDGNGNNFSASIRIRYQVTVSSAVPVITTTSIPKPITVTITPSSKTTILGSDFSLNCSSNVMGSFSWIPPYENITHDVSITTANNGLYSTYQISSVQNYHAGNYTCQLLLNDNHHFTRYQLIVQNASTTSEPQFSRPEVTISSSNTFAIVGSEFSLKCSSDMFGEFHWNRTNATTLDFNVTNNEGFYSILHIFSVQPSHAGTYICQVYANGITQSNTFQVMIQNGVSIQLQLSEVFDCNALKKPKNINEESEIAMAIVDIISSNCTCGFSSVHLTDSLLVCDSSCPQSAVYQTKIYDTEKANSSKLISILQEKITQNGIDIETHSSLFKIKSIDTTTADNLLQCNSLMSTPPMNLALIISTIIAIIIASLAFIAIFAVLIFFCRTKKIKLRFSRKKESGQSHSVPMDCLSNESNEYSYISTNKLCERSVKTTSNKPALVSEYAFVAMRNYSTSNDIYEAPISNESNVTSAAPYEVPSTSHIKSAAPYEVPVSNGRNVTSAEPYEVPVSNGSNVTSAAPYEVPTSNRGNFPSAAPYEVPVSTESHATSAAPHEVSVSTKKQC